MMKTKIAMALALCAGICTVAPSAHADPTNQPTKDGKGYAYEFPDDKLLTADGAGVVPMIKVRPKAKRDLLHRPRLQFVQEMLKSVENM
jgi:hypothetical protein